MKKNICLFLLFLSVALLFSACGTKEEIKYAETTGKVPTVLNSSEYVLYQNIFQNGYAKQYAGKKVTKRGIFTTLYDAYNERTRYYVWGHLDQTKCCDWQWEIVIDDTAGLPANGSLVEVSGIFDADESALDGYWIREATVATLTRYVGKTADVDMCTMSDTLEYVQLASINTHGDVFEGKTVSAYGRIYDLENIQDPYYDGSWVTRFSSSMTLPAIGTSVVLRGIIASSVISDATIEIIAD